MPNKITNLRNIKLADIKKIEAPQILSLLSRASLFIAERAFAVTIGLIGLAIILSAFLYYKYGRAENVLIPKESDFALKKDVYNEVLQTLEKRAIEFKEADSKTYLNAFEPR